MATRAFDTEPATHAHDEPARARPVTPPPSTALTPTAVLALQRTAGNRAVTALLQRKLDPEAAKRFRLWVAEQKDYFLLPEQDVNGIAEAASTLEEAQELALHHASQSSMTKRVKTDKEKKGTLGEKLRPLVEELERVLAVPHDKGRTGPGGFGQAVPTAVHSLAMALIRTYPPDRHTYVCLGNSPAFLLATCQNDPRFPQEAIVHLPLGGLSKPGSPLEKEAGAETFAPAMLKGFWGEGVNAQAVGAHFNRHLTGASQRGKPLVVVDFSSTGASVLFAADMIERWLERSLPVLSFAVIDAKAEELVGRRFDEMGRDGALAIAVGDLEKLFVDMEMKEILKKQLLLLGPAEVKLKRIIEVYKADKDQDPGLDRSAYYQRMVRVLGIVKSVMSPEEPPKEALTLTK